MALALVVVAQQILTTGLAPVSNQRLWLDKFVGWSFYWVLFGVVESVLIGFLFYVREDHRVKNENKRISMMASEEDKSMMRRLAESEEAEEAAKEMVVLADNPEEYDSQEESQRASSPSSKKMVACIRLACEKSICCLFFSPLLHILYSLPPCTGQ
jgi:hypothetical protein